MRSLLEGKNSMRALEDESQRRFESAEEVDRRSDTANTIALLMVSSEVFIVTVEPHDGQSLPFHLEVDRGHAADAYRHPYAYASQSAEAA